MQRCLMEANFGMGLTERLSVGLAFCLETSLIFHVYKPAWPSNKFNSLKSSPGSNSQLDSDSVVTWYGILGCVEEWHIPGKTKSKRVHYRLQTRTIERRNTWHHTVLATFLGFRKLLYSCTEGMCHSSTRPGMSYHMTQFYQAFPRISTASDKRWDVKALVRGYTSVMAQMFIALIVPIISDLMIAW